MNRTELFKGSVLTSALELAADQKEAVRDRVMCARVAAEVCDHVDWSESLATDVMRALAGCLDAPQAAEELVDIIRRKVLDRERVIAPLLRLSAAAFDRKQFAGLNVLMLVMLDDNETWAARVREQWVEAVLGWAQGRLRGGRDLAGELLHLWISNFGADHAWLRPIILSGPVLLSSRWLPFTQRQQLTYVAPTAWAWRHFAFHRPPELERWDPARFGKQLRPAIDSLQAAITESELAGDSAGAVTLAEWLTGLLDGA